MATPCIVRFIQNGKPMCAFYKHHDGPDFKSKLEAFFSDKKVVSGLSLDPLNEVNGVADLAAQTIANFKTGPGDVYMVDANDEEMYTYEVSIVDKTISVKTIEV